MAKFAFLEFLVTVNQGYVLQSKGLHGLPWFGFVFTYLRPSSLSDKRSGLGRCLAGISGPDPFGDPLALRVDHGLGFWILVEC